MIASKLSTLPSMSSAFGDRIKQAREDKGWSQSELGEAAGVSRQAIFSVETGENKTMRPENLFRAADALGVKARWLATGEGPKTQELDRTIKADVLKMATLDVEKAVSKASGKLTLEKKCELITALYEMYISGEKPSNVVRLVQLASQNTGPLI